MAEPITVRLDCPACGLEHVCENFGAPCGGLTGAAAVVHTCSPGCFHKWRPFSFPVVGATAPDEGSDAVVCYAEHAGEGHDGVGFYYYDAEYPDKGSCGAFLALEDAARDAVTSGNYGRVRFDPEALVAAQGEVGNG